MNALATQITTLQTNCILQWKEANHIELMQDGFLRLAEENLAFNYRLWHAEDRARRDDKGHEFVYQAKRDIDQFNQARNNRMENMDQWLFNALHPAEPNQAPVHSETPGMIIDRLAILALKAYHMQLQTKRDEVDETHRQSCLTKLRTIEAQKTQLTLCLDELLESIKNKTRTFRIYHQFKMYNDPKLNPELYGPIT